DDLASAMAIDESGRIVVAGSTRAATGLDFAIARYTTDGSLDTTFGNGGKLTTDLESGGDIATCVVIDADSKIVVAGATGDYINRDFATVCYNADGSLDSGVGRGGQMLTD